jgi:hypothetical protein
VAVWSRNLDKKALMRVFPHVILGKHLGVAVTVKKQVWRLAVACALLFSSVAGLMLAETALANPGFIFERALQPIIIASNGYMSDPTQSIQRNGNTYFLTKDVEGRSLSITRSNMILDGGGHLLNCTPDTHDAIVLHSVSNVTVKNLQIIGGGKYAVALRNSSNCTIEDVESTHSIYFSQSQFNTISKCNVGIEIGGGSNNNTITKNNVAYIFFDRAPKSFNIFFLNNIMLNEYPDLFSANLWDNGSVGNYWSNYTTTWPTASEIGYTGIGNIPYVVMRSDYSTKESPSALNVDHFPLMYPYDVEKDQIALPDRSFQPSSENMSSIVPMAGVSTITITGIAAGIIYHQKKRKR